MSPTSMKAALTCALLLLISACGGGGAPAVDPGTFDASPAPATFTAEGACDTVAGHGSCMAMRGMTASGLSANQSACTATGGTFVASCPSTGLVGTCTIPSPLVMGRLHLYAPWTAANGPILCMNGAWSAPNPPAETAATVMVSCQDPWEGTCADTSGAMTPTLRLGVQRYCTGNDRTLLAGPCPTAERSGTCTTAPGELTWRTRHYDPVNSMADEQQCAAQGGLWTAG